MGAAIRGSRPGLDNVSNAPGQIVWMPPISMIAACLEWMLESQTRIYVASVESIAASNTFVAICWLNLIRLCAPPTERPQLMDEVERDRSVTVNVGFGNITFCRDENGAYAHAVVDLGMDLGQEERRENKIEVAMRFSCSPEKESIADLVERSRRHLSSLLQSAVSHIEKETAESLLYGPEP